MSIGASSKDLEGGSKCYNHMLGSFSFSYYSWSYVPYSFYNCCVNFLFGFGVEVSWGEFFANFLNINCDLNSLNKNLQVMESLTSLKKIDIKKNRIQNI